MNAVKINLPYKVHRNIFLFFAAVLCVGLFFSVFLVSVAGIGIAANWLWEGNLKNKLQKLRKSKPALLVLLFFALHIAGLLWTNHDYDYGLKDIRIKLPLLLFPVVLSTVNPFSRMEEKILGGIFILTALTATFYSYYLYRAYYPHEITDIRNISVFISHIRFSLLLVTAIILLFYGIYTKHIKGYVLYLAAFAGIWFVYFIGLLHVISGALGLAAIIITGVILFAHELKKKHRIALIFTLSAAFVITLSYFGSKAYDYLRHKDSPDYSITKTAQGEKYIHDKNNNLRENGYLIYRFIAPIELEKAWNERSRLKFDGYDKRNQPLRSTLIRFLTSKGEKKDAEGVHNLTAREVEAIENGIAGKPYLNASGLELRMLKVLYELNNYREGANPSGHSVAMRIEFLKTGIHIFKKYPLLGTGTGDVPHEFEAAYNETNNELSSKYRYRAHNQFLTIALTFGIPGLSLFILCFVFSVRTANRLQNKFFILFIIHAALSMISEDTLETQIGVTFFSFFFFVFLYNLSLYAAKGNPPT